MSHVPFKSANVVENLDELIIKLKKHIGKIVIDGSAAFANLPTDLTLGKVMDEIYYIGGIYKFLGAGEGFSFMSIPVECQDRPVMTGWLWGDYKDEKHYYSKPLFYASDADRYANSTLECSVWMRANEIIEYFNQENLTVEMRNKYTSALQDYMVRKIDEANLSFISSKNLVTIFGKWRPLQTCFDFSKGKWSAEEIVKKLEKHNVIADYRGSILRLCMSIYHTAFDIDILVDKLKLIEKELFNLKI